MYHFADAGKTNPIKPNFKLRCTLCEFFLFFTFLCPIYNLAMQTWTIQKLLNWVTEHFTKKGIDSLRQAGENDGGRGRPH